MLNSWQNDVLNEKMREKKKRIQNTKYSTIHHKLRFKKKIKIYN